jgi:D-alanyl-D-alanine carboxypeptidase
MGAIQRVKNDPENWKLLLINAENPLPDDFSPMLDPIGGGLQFDARAAGQLVRMLSAAKAQGLSPVVCSAYRSVDRQRVLYDEKVRTLMADGLDRARAEMSALQSVAYPGTSEHHLGLAVDIVSVDYQLLDARQADTPEARWLTQHCAQYGFILRYPEEKQEITGIIYEPWHFRYVGVDAAEEMAENGACLEEYVGRR